MAESLPESELNRELVKTVQEHWGQRQVAILLSQLGSQIDRAELSRIKEEYGNLAAYLRQELSDYVSLIQSSDNPTIVGAIPTGLEPHILTNLDALLQTTRRSAPTSRRFHPAFWAAFVKELAPDARRHISVGPPPRFRDLQQDATPDNTIEVPREYIVGTDEDIGKLHESIGKWLQEHSLAEDVFLAGVPLTQDPLPRDELARKVGYSAFPRRAKAGVHSDGHRQQTTQQVRMSPRRWILAAGLPPEIGVDFVATFCEVFKNSVLVITPSVGQVLDALLSCPLRPLCGKTQAVRVPRSAHHVGKCAPRPSLLGQAR